MLHLINQSLNSVNKQDMKKAQAHSKSHNKMALCVAYASVC